MGLLKTCPRCGEKTLEKLATHSHCGHCNYAPDLLQHRNLCGDDLPIPPWAAQAVKQSITRDAKAFTAKTSIQPKTKFKKGSAA